MVISLADFQANLADDFDFATVDELRQGSPYLLNLLPFDDVVVPGTNGGTLTYSYRRAAFTRPAHTRRLNTEYPAFEAKRIRKSVDLVPMGARYNIDRVMARIGATSEVDFQQAEAVRATIALWNDTFINGQAGADFDSEDPDFEGIDSIVTGTIMESTAPGGDPWDFDTITNQAQAQAVSRALRAWLREFDGEPTAFFVNKDGAALLDTVNDFLSQMTTTQDDFGRDVSTYRGIPYVELGMKPGAVDHEGVLTGEEPENEVIETDDDGVTSIYAARIGMDSLHGVATPGNLFYQWLPEFNTAGAVKPGEVELGPAAIVAKKVRGVGAFRVKVAA